MCPLLIYHWKKNIKIKFKKMLTQNVYLKFVHIVVGTIRNCFEVNRQLVGSIRDFICSKFPNRRIFTSVIIMALSIQSLRQMLLESTDYENL